MKVSITNPQSKIQIVVNRKLEWTDFLNEDFPQKQLRGNQAKEAAARAIQVQAWVAKKRGPEVPCVQRQKMLSARPCEVFLPHTKGINSCSSSAMDAIHCPDGTPRRNLKGDHREAAVEYRLEANTGGQVSLRGGRERGGSFRGAGPKEE